MRDLLLFALIFGLLPFCARRVWIGILVWAWIGYMNPHRMTWGPAWDFPFAQLVALSTLLGVALHVVREGSFPRLPLVRETILLIAFYLMLTVSTVFALRPDWAWPEWKDISKIFLMTFLMILFIDTRDKLRYLLLVTALSLGFFGLKGGIFAIARGGQYMVLGPERSFIQDNTALGIALNMVLPLLFFLGRTETNRWLKLLLRTTFFLSILSVLFTYSRGALLGLLVVLGLLYIRLRLSFKVVVGLILLIALPTVIAFIPQHWLDKMQSIQTYESDGSALGRIDAWKTAWRVALDHPFTGGGFQIIDDLRTYSRYNPYAIDPEAGVHSVYFEVIAETGFVGFAIFMSLLASALLSLRKLRRYHRANGPPETVEWINAIEASIVGYAIAGAFLEFAFFDLYYQLLAIVIALKSFQFAEQSDPSVAPAPDDRIPRLSASTIGPRT